MLRFIPEHTVYRTFLTLGLKRIFLYDKVYTKFGGKSEIYNSCAYLSGKVKEYCHLLTNFEDFSCGCYSSNCRSSVCELALYKNSLRIKKHYKIRASG